MNNFKNQISLLILTTLFLGIINPLALAAAGENTGSGTTEKPGIFKKIKNIFSDDPSVISRNFDKMAKKAEKMSAKAERIKIKEESAEFKNLKKEQKDEFKAKIEQLKNKGLSRFAKDIRDELEAQKKDFEKLSNELAGTTEQSAEQIKEFKDQLKKRYDLLKKLNKRQERDLEKAILQKLNEEEQDLLEFTEPNYLLELQGNKDAFVPNDEQFANQWSLAFIGEDGFAQAKKNIDKNKNHDKPIIAVIDTGFDLDHPELADAWWGRSECYDYNGNLIEGGCPVGYDVVGEDTNPEDETFSHGTAVAGVIGAATNNEEGIASLSNNLVEIMPIRACSNDGYFRVEDVVEGIYFAVNNGADVINMSLGGGTYSTTLYDAVNYAQDNGVVVVAAAGNYGQNNDVNPLYPASYDLDNIISAGAYDDKGYLASFSNYGATTVDILAPGVNVLTTTTGGGTRVYSGTSFSSPMVAAALVRYFVEGNGKKVVEGLLGDVNGYESLKFFIDGGRRLEFGEMKEEEGEKVKTDPANKGGNLKEKVKKLVPPSEVEVTDRELTIDDLLQGEIHTIIDDDDTIAEAFPDLVLRERALLFGGFVENGAPDFNGFMKIAMIELMSDGLFTNKDINLKEAKEKVVKDCTSVPPERFLVGGEDLPENDYLGNLRGCFLLYARPGGYPYGHGEDFPIQFDFEHPDYYTDPAYWVKVILAYHASSREEYEKWMSFGEGSLYETYEKLFGWPNRYFDPNGAQVLGQRTLLQKAPLPIKEQSVNNEKLTHEEILALSQELFPQVPEGVIKFLYREDELVDFYPRRMYKISKYTGFLEQDIKNNLKYNILSNIALMERQKKIMFGDADITSEEWGDVLILEMGDAKNTMRDSYQQGEEFKKNKDEKENLRIFLSYLNEQELSEVVIPSTLINKIDQLFLRKFSEKLHNFFN